MVQRDPPNIQNCSFASPQAAPWPQMKEGQRAITRCLTRPPSPRWLLRVARGWRNAEASLLYSPENGQSRTKATPGLESPFTEVPSLPSDCTWRWKPFHITEAGHDTWTMQYPYRHPLPKHKHLLSQCQIVLSLGNYPVGVLTRKCKHIPVPCSFSLKAYCQRQSYTDFKEEKCQNIGSILMLEKQ